MIWDEITIHTSEQALELITDLCHELGSGGVAIEQSEPPVKPSVSAYGEWYELPLSNIPQGEAYIRAYFARPADGNKQQISDLVAKLQQSIDQLQAADIDVSPAEITVQQVDEEDWAHAWKQYFKPVRIADTITIKPTWEVYEPQPEELIIALDPGMAFGTGTHPTTKLCIQALEKFMITGSEVIDVGCGSGVLSIAACKLGAGQVLALDLDPLAVSVSLENVRINKLNKCVTVMKSDLLSVLAGHVDAGIGPGSLGISLPVKLVVSNILAEIIIRFVDDVYAVLQPTGIYISSGIIKNKEADVANALLTAGFAIEARYYEEDWVALVARK